MCFSAPASFTASAVLVTTGVIAQSKSKGLGQNVLATIPFLFGLQQFCEGILWLTFSHTGLAFMERSAMYGFLIFAQVLWPAFIPICFLLNEKDEKGRRILKFLAIFGGLVSAILLFCLITHPTHAHAECYHVFYDIYYPLPPKYGGIFYFIPTAIPPFVSKLRKIKWLAVLLFIAYVICKIFYIRFILSVWCFFASLVSIIILYVIIEENKSKPIN
jgi:hypothetical protein